MTGSGKLLIEALKEGGQAAAQLAVTSTHTEGRTC